MHQNTTKTNHQSPTRNSENFDQLILKGHRLHDQAIGRYLAEGLAKVTAGFKKAAGFSVKTGGRSIHSGTC